MAVVEAGLGGRYDATSVIDAPVTVLTNVGLEHTRWLGPTVRHIAEEKLAAVRPRGACWCSARTSTSRRWPWPAAWPRERGARIVHAGPPQEHLAAGAPGAPSSGATSRSRGRPPRPTSSTPASPCDEQAVRRGGRRDRGPRAPAGAQRGPADDPRRRPQPRRRGLRSLRSLPEVLGERPLALVLGVLEDKDAAAMLERCCRLRAGLVHGPARPAARCRRPRCSRWPASSASRGRVASRAAARRSSAAQRWARERDGAVLVTGSVYLVGEVLLGRGSKALNEPRAPSSRDERRGPSVLTMIGAVALIVALVILVFFAAGYGFGRLFL